MTECLGRIVLELDGRRRAATITRCSWISAGANGAQPVAPPQLVATALLIWARAHDVQASAALQSFNATANAEARRNRPQTLIEAVPHGGQAVAAPQLPAMLQALVFTPMAIACSSWIYACEHGMMNPTAAL